MSGAAAEELDQNKNTEEEVASPLSMADDELSNLSLEDLDNLDTSDDDTTGDDDDDGEQSESGESDGDGESEGGTDSGESDDGETNADGESEGTAGDGAGDSGSDESGDGESGSTDSEFREGSDSDDSKTEETSKDDESGQSKSTSEDDKQTNDSSEVNFKDEHAKLLAPFRANNKDMQVRSVEEARTLMQMGANYNKKMAGLKPNLKLIKMLDNNNLLDEAKLSFLIDLDKKEPEAVKKFIKDSGVNLDEIDLESDHSYKSNTYSVDDKEIELDGVIDDIKDTQSFNQTIDVISNKWDESSKKVLVEQPNIIKIINEHVSTGVYDRITQTVDRERMLGHLEGVSDLDAYMQIGDSINDAGGFNNMNNSGANTEITNKPTPKPKKTVDPKIRDRKKAASATKTASSKSKGNADFNPLALSDEEFEKAAGSMNL